MCKCQQENNSVPNTALNKDNHLLSNPKPKTRGRKRLSQIPNTTAQMVRLSFRKATAENWFMCKEF